ncbi:hypothetical protein GGR56DRAFT_218567 [Xylariaceae sp. FL0804]|nr:hypothetical protein GGR56DRAFT_218567 [Xylariaceae sp. FL0804]
MEWYKSEYELRDLQTLSPTLMPHRQLVRVSSLTPNTAICGISEQHEPSQRIQNRSPTQLQRMPGPQHRRHPRGLPQRDPVVAGPRRDAGLLDRRRVRPRPRHTSHPGFGAIPAAAAHPPPPAHHRAPGRLLPRPGPGTTTSGCCTCASPAAKSGRSRREYEALERRHNNTQEKGAERSPAAAAAADEQTLLLAYEPLRGRMRLSRYAAFLDVRTTRRVAGGDRHAGVSGPAQARARRLRATLAIRFLGALLDQFDRRGRAARRDEEARRPTRPRPRRVGRRVRGRVPPTEAPELLGDVLVGCWWW